MRAPSRSSSRRLVLPLLAFAAAVLAAPSRVDACSPPPPGVWTVVPAAGVTEHPANAWLVFSVFEADPTALTVTVDGEEAALVPAADAPAGWATAAFRVEPTPAEGATVLLTGDPCTDGGCPFEASFTATAADTTPPPGPDAVRYDAYDYVDFKSSGGDCQIDSDLAWYVHVERAAGSEPVFATVEIGADATFSRPITSTSSYVTGDDEAVFGLQILASQLGATGILDVCARVAFVDVAGNPAGEPTVVCDPCHYRADTTVQYEFAPVEPEWTQGEAVPGGPCASPDPTTGTGSGGGTGTGGGAGTGGDDGDGGGGDGADPDASFGGCGCAIAERSPEGALAATTLLACAAAFARRRRRG